MNLRGVDLNLLVILDALLREQSVTRAAQAIGLSQPAMSNALARLRDLLKDPVLVRTPEGMLPTARAMALAAPLAAALRQINDAVLAPADFDPAASTRTFNVATADYEQLVLLPPLTERLAKVAPHVRLHFTTPQDRLPVEDLYLGRIDLMIGVHEEDHAGLYKAPLLEDRFVCALAEKHPDAKGRLTLSRYASLDHLLISPFGGMTGHVDRALAAHGLSRTVKLAVPYFSLAPFILVRSAYVLTLPERAARLFAGHLPLRLVKPPLEIPGFTESMFWHERNQSDPAHRWFRGLVKECAAGLKDR